MHRSSTVRLRHSNTHETSSAKLFPPTRMDGAALSNYRVDASKQHGTYSPLRQRAAQKYIHNGYEEQALLTSNMNGRSSAKHLPSGCIEQHSTSSPRQHEWTKQR
mmetsp:Transcript_32689/g.55061  ORF Transcript_32689/g.55061 Transcript_32689/m.55061 type:complete len:105 (-) Transcript_32689:2092-2406(-)